MFGLRNKKKNCDTLLTKVMCSGAFISGGGGGGGGGGVQYFLRQKLSPEKERLL